MSVLAQLEASGEVLSPAVRAVIERLEKTIAELQERVRELEARLGLNSTNSSKPPSSDGPGVPRAAKQPKGRKRVGQHGHKGHHRMLLPPGRVDHVRVHAPETCERCGHSLVGAEEMLPAQVHQVVEVPPVRAEMTEHRMLCLRCPGCSAPNRAAVPAGGKGFGPRVSALVGVLVGHYRMSRRSVTDLLGQLLDVPAPSLGSTEACTQETSAALEAAYGEIKAEVRGSGWACVDETPWKLRGQKMWLWVGAAERATVCRLGRGRGRR